MKIVILKVQIMYMYMNRIYLGELLSGVFRISVAGCICCMRLPMLKQI